MPDTTFNFPNITISKTYRNGEHNGYDIVPNDGYVMYSQSLDVITNIDPFTGEEVTETYYCRYAWIPKNFNFDNFDYIAVLESEVPADHIFGGGNNHAVM